MGFFVILILIFVLGFLGLFYFFRSFLGNFFRNLFGRFLRRFFIFIIFLIFLFLRSTTL